MSLRIIGCLCLLLIVGCSNSLSPFAYVPVSGQVTYEDGSPIGNGGMRIQFVSVDQAPVGESYPRPGFTTIDQNGHFDIVTSYKYGDGLIPGKHKVAILDAQDKSGKLLVPEEYTDVKTSPVIVSTDNLPLEIKVPKP